MTNLPLTVLILEDQSDYVAVLATVMRNGGFEPIIQQVQTKEAFERGIRVINPNIVLCDCTLEQYNAEEALAFLATVPVVIPCILLCDTTTDNKVTPLLTPALKDGAVDFVFKEYPKRLPHAISRALDVAMARRDYLQQEQAIIEYLQSLHTLRDSVGDPQRSAEEQFESVRQRAQKLQDFLKIKEP